MSLARATEYADLLAAEAVLRGLIGPREVPRLWERHLLNCAVVAELIEDGATVADLGSGAGLPGVVLAIRRPDLHLTLIEPLLRRTTFLEQVVSTMGLDNVVVRRGRAEDLAGEVEFDVVTSRAVAPLERLTRWSMPLVRPGGRMLAMKGSSADDEIRRDATVVARLGARDVRLEHVGAPWVSPEVQVVSATRDGRR